METGYDIIFFWVARMVMLGLALLDEAPFETVYLSGLIRDPYGKKMSKTTGNVVDPLEIIDSTGADALRFALIHGATPGLDQKFGAAKVENARNFANKLWNATRFVLGSRPDSIPAGSPRLAPDPARLGPAERWIRSRRAKTIATVDRALSDFQFAEMTRALYEAIWSEFCDWGLELAKVRLGDAALPDPDREATWWTLVEALDAYLRLLHPVMPFVTEELWGSLPRAKDDPDLLIVASWPVAEEDGASESPDVGADVDALIDLIRAVRNARAESGIDAAAWVPMWVTTPPRLAPAMVSLRPALERLLRARPLTFVASRAALDAADAPGTLAVLSGEIDARIRPSAREVPADPGRDRDRLEKELSEAVGFLVSARARLANEAFVAKAPPDVVAGARARADELTELVARLRARLEA